MNMWQFDPFLSGGGAIRNEYWDCSDAANPESIAFTSRHVSPGDSQSVITITLCEALAIPASLWSRFAHQRRLPTCFVFDACMSGGLTCAAAGCGAQVGANGTVGTTVFHYKPSFYISNHKATLECMDQVTPSLPAPSSVRPHGESGPCTEAW
eukprot:1046425-Rhodomonas_salina.6